MALSLKGVILVGGPSVGTRFRPLSMDCPKPLFPIAGVAMIHHHVSSLAKTPGMREILLIGFFENAVFDRFITEVSIEFPHLSIRYLREYQSLGTGGGVYHFRDEILRGAPNAFFVLNGDIASSFPLNEMLLAHRNKKALATVMGIRVDKSKAHRYGCIVADADSRVIHFVEKPQSFISDLISCGVYLLSSDVFGYFQKAIQVRRDTEAELGLQSDQLANMSIYSSNAVLNSRSEERLQLEQDVLRVLATEKVLFAFEASSHKDFWMAVKHGSSAIPANRKYLQYFMQAQPRRLSEPVLLSPGKRLSFANSPAVTTPSVMSPAAMSPSTRDHPELIAPVYIHPSAIIHPSAKIGPNVSIGPRALIGRGVRIRDSLILDAVEIKNDACVLNAIVGWDSKIGAWARIEGSADQDEGAQDAATSKGFKIPTAAILGKNVTVSDEVIVRDCIVLPHKELKSSFQREILM